MNSLIGLAALVATLFVALGIADPPAQVLQKSRPAVTIPPPPPPPAPPEVPKAPRVPEVESFGPLTTVAPDEAQKLEQKFLQAQAQELKALKHRHGLEFKEFQRLQARRLKTFEVEEEEKKFKQFEQLKDADSRRKYTSEIETRKKELIADQEKESQEKLVDFAEREKELLERHERRRKLFTAYLAKGERPPENLWPRF